MRAIISSAWVWLSKLYSMLTSTKLIVTVVVGCKGPDGAGTAGADGLTGLIGAGDKAGSVAFGAGAGILGAAVVFGSLVVVFVVLV